MCSDLVASSRPRCINVDSEGSRSVKSSLTMGRIFTEIFDGIRLPTAHCAPETRSFPSALKNGLARCIFAVTLTPAEKTAKEDSRGSRISQPRSEEFAEAGRLCARRIQEDQGGLV